MARIAVLVPARDEEAYIPRALEGLAAQEPAPGLVVLADNGSRDSTVAVARRAARRLGLDLLVVGAPWDPGRGKHNIAVAYEAAWRALQESGYPATHVATLEADTVLGEGYYSRLLEALSSDPRGCVAGGRLDPLGLPRDPWPLPVALHLWGANRLYTRACWRLLEALAPLHTLPSWDTDHVVLAYLLGLGVHRVPGAASRALRPDRPPRPLDRGRTDAWRGHSPAYALLRALRLRSPTYLAGYLQGLLNKPPEARGLRLLAEAYRRGEARALRRLVRIPT